MMSNSNDSDDRKMNDSTMPPPLSRRTMTSATPGQTSNLSLQTESKNESFAKARVKVPRRKGFGLSDWQRLVKASKDLAMRGGQPLRRAISWDEIRTHNSVHDGWMVLKGKVYFISPYLAYHPGGESILKKVLGRDATSLYEKYHRCVNEEGLIGKLLIGYVDNTAPGQDATRDRDGFAIPQPKALRSVESILPNKSSESEESDDELLSRKPLS